MKPNTDGIVYLDDFQLTDASAMLAADRDSEHRKRFEFPPDFVPSLEHTRNVIRGWIYDKKLGTRYTYAVRATDSTCLVGGAKSARKTRRSRTSPIGHIQTIGAAELLHALSQSPVRSLRNLESSDWKFLLTKTTRHQGLLQSTAALFLSLIHISEPTRPY